MATTQRWEEATPVSRTDNTTAERDARQAPFSIRCSLKGGGAYAPVSRMQRGALEHQRLGLIRMAMQLPRQFAGN